MSKKTKTRRVPIKEAAEAMGLTCRRLRQLCAEGAVVGARLSGEGNRAAWTVLVDAQGFPRIRGSR